MGFTILLVTHELSYTGAPTSLLRIAKVLKSNNIDVEVWSLKAGLFASEFEKLNFQVKIINSPINIIPDLKKFKGAIVNTIALAEYAEIISQYIPTIWYIREAMSIYKYLDAKPRTIKTLSTFKHLYCVSEYAASIIRKFNPNVKVLHNCVEDYSQLALPHRSIDKIRFIQLGTIDKRKGFDVIIESYEQLPEEYKSKIEIFFAGQKVDSFINYYNSFIQKCKSSGIIYLGEITNVEERIQICSRMDVFIIASRDESCSLTALESIMLSKPLIVTENVGAKYVVTPDNGIVVKTGSVEDLSNALKYFVDHVDKLDELGKVSRKIYENTSNMEIYSANILKMIENCIFHYYFHPFDYLKRGHRLVEIKINNYLTHDNIFSKIKYMSEKKIKVEKKKSDEIVVSLTSYPPRIKSVSKTIKSILKQTLKPDAIELWLALEEFPNKEADLPFDLVKLTKKGLSICWGENIAPHKKYFYTMLKHPNSIIITVDDDVRYSHNLVSKLYKSYLKYPNCVSAMRAHRIIFTSRGGIKPYSRWIKEDKALVGEPSYQAIATGIGGVLYPPGMTKSEYFNIDLIKNNCLFADDIWLKCIEMSLNIPTVVLENYMPVQELKNTQKCGLFNSNVLDNRNDAYMSECIKIFSERGCDLLKMIKKDIRQWDYWECPPLVDSKIAIMCPAGKKYTEHNGDYHFCKAIKKYFEQENFIVDLRCVEDWYEPFDGKYVLTLRGSKQYYPQKKHTNVMWNISHPERISIQEYNDYDVVFIASINWSRVVAEKVNVPVYPLLQCTDSDLFSVTNERKYDYELLFVGYAHEEGRKIIEDILPTEFNLSVFGPKWKGKIDDKYICGEMIPNNLLAEYYHNSKIVLNDHLQTMRENGFVSNRIYDVSAAGGFIISDNNPEIREIFGDLAVTYTTRKELNEKINYYLNNETERLKIIDKMRAIVLNNHTFKHRVHKIIDILFKLDNHTLD